MLLEPGGKANGKPAPPPPPTHTQPSQAEYRFRRAVLFLLVDEMSTRGDAVAPSAEEGLGSTCFLIVASSGSERGP